MCPVQGLHGAAFASSCPEAASPLSLPLTCSWLGEQRVLLVALAASAIQQLILAMAGAKWVAFLGISLGSLGRWGMALLCGGLGYSRL